MVPYVDVHCHLDFQRIYEKLDEVMEKAKKNDVLIVTTGVNSVSNRLTLEIGQKFGMKVALGIYPMDALDREAKEGNDFDYVQELDFIRQNKDKIVAISEVGMDYFNGGETDSAKESQKEVFRKVIELSKEIKKPMIIHSRKAERDVVDILEEMDVDPDLVVMHCFSGRKSLIKRGIENKWNFTVPTNIVRNESFQSMVKNIDIKKLFCETDSPWLSPFGRDEMNEPANVIESYKEIARIKGLTLEEVRNMIYMNYQRVFL